MFIVCEFLVMSECYILLGAGMVDVYMLNGVGDRTPSCGTPLKLCRYFFLNIV